MQLLLAGQHQCEFFAFELIQLVLLVNLRHCIYKVHLRAGFVHRLGVGFVLETVQEGVALGGLFQLKFRNIEFFLELAELVQVFLLAAHVKNIGHIDKRINLSNDGFQHGKHIGIKHRIACNLVGSHSGKGVVQHLLH